MFFTNAVWQKTVAQQSANPDSIIMVKDPVTNQISFLFPIKAATEYRNLLAEQIPAYKRTIATQDSEIISCKTLVDTKKKEIIELESIIAAERLKNSKLDTLNHAYEIQLKSKKFWQRASYVLLGSTAILTGIVLVK